MKQFAFNIIHRSKKSRARVGAIYTPHGTINTPNFVGVGTQAVLKAVDSVQLREIGLQLMFCNSYHLMLQPGSKVIKAAGGLHQFMNCSIPLITDSGGFQVFSLAYGGVAHELKNSGAKKNHSSVLKITEEGVLFRSYRDGSKILFTPELSIAIQKDLGADIIIPFDELPPYHVERHDLKKSLYRTHRWEKRSLDVHKKKTNNQAMYAVIHGGIDLQLRKESCDYLGRQPFDGFAIGGSLGKTREEMLTILDTVMPLIDDSKPNHLLGIGDVISIDQCIKRGIDTFDSSHPTRSARHGLLFTREGSKKILHQSNKFVFRPIEETCTCIVCQHYTLAYLHHLFKAKELTGYTLATIHNVHFMVRLMHAYRMAILNDEI